MRSISSLMLLTLFAGCTGQLQAFPPLVEQVAGSPSQISAAVIKNEKRDLDDLAAVLCR